MRNIIEKLEEMNNNLRLNTSYPLNRQNWYKYQSEKNIFEGIKDFSVYIHIPFCNALCKFCEYTKCVKQNKEIETKVIDTIIKDIEKFKYPKMMYGLDVGGGTPTCLFDDNFSKILDISSKIIANSNQPTDFLPSIEGTFESLSDNKIELLKKSVFKRISFGIQVLNKSFLEDNERNSDIQKIKSVIEKIRNHFIVNIDIMYGLNNITLDDLRETINFVNSLNVDEITLYETRYNSIGLKPQKSKMEIIYEYDYCYNLITLLGYYGYYGRNTFSKRSPSSFAVSSYLNYRMKGYFYKGFGPSAQSMTKLGLSYNKFKNNFCITPLLEASSFENGNNYFLPENEIMAKLICISLYKCSINLNCIKKLYNIDIYNKKQNIIQELSEAGLIEIKSGDLFITKAGYKYYSAIGNMLYT